MAQHGGSAAEQPQPQPGAFTLQAPRPDSERAANEYVEAPVRGRPPPPPPPVAPPAHHPRQQPRRTARPQLQPQPQRPRHLALPPVAKQPTFGHQPVVHQPKISPSGKDPPPPPTPHPAQLDVSTSAPCAGRPSIVCPECGRCRCEACRRPQRLPQRWLCGGACLLSADAVVDYASCLCCAKALFYHCADGDGDGGSDGARCADRPCGCGAERRAQRWACLAALSCALPCLWLYWPLRGARAAVERCYARGSRVGCRCRPSTISTAPTPEKRLLDSHHELF